MIVKRPLKLEKAAVAALEDIKAQDITVLDVRKLTPLYETLIIASAASARQTKALARHVRDRLKAAGAEIVGVEGEEGGEWVLVDCGEIVVHVMQPAIRAYYNLEELWMPPTPVRPIRKTAKAPAAAAKKTPVKTAAKTPAKVPAKTAVKRPAKTPAATAAKRAPAKKKTGA